MRLGLRLAKAAVDVGADLVIVGTRGLGGAQAVLGSVSDLVVHHCPRPTLVIPYPMLAAESAALPEGPVAIGWDSSVGARNAYEAAARLFPERDLLLVSVHEDPGGSTDSEEVPADPARNVIQVNVKRKEGFRNRAVSDALIGAARDREAALVVVGSRGRSAAREILLGSVAMGTLHHSHRPVMVVPGAGEPTASE